MLAPHGETLRLAYTHRLLGSRTKVFRSYDASLYSVLTSLDAMVLSMGRSSWLFLRPEMVEWIHFKNAIHLMDVIHRTREIKAA